MRSVHPGFLDAGGRSPVGPEEQAVLVGERQRAGAPQPLLHQQLPPLAVQRAGLDTGPAPVRPVQLKPTAPLGQASQGEGDV